MQGQIAQQSGWCLMAHNRSPRKRASNARTSHLAEWIGWTLAADCRPCGRGSWVEVHVLGCELPGRTVGRVLDRMRL